MIDSHCHLNFNTLAENIEKILDDAKNNNITAILSIDTNPLNFRDHLKLIKRFNGLYISYGIHPCEVNSDEQLENLNFEKYCNDSHVIAIGETGIDLFHSKKRLEKQIKSFRLHIEASIKYELPIIIHQRDSENEIIEVLKDYLNYDLKVVFHCFTGTKKLLDFCLQNKFYISLSGIITFKNADNLRKIIKNVPLEFILIETDSPFLSPEPMRGKSNEPSYLRHTAEYLSNFYNLKLTEFELITDDNFFNLFKKTKRENRLL